MTDQAIPANAGAQPVADANSIDGIVDAATTPATPETPEEEPAEPNEPAEPTKDEPFPKKAINALSRRDKQIGKLRAEREQLAAELEKVRAQQTVRPTEKPVNTGEPQEKDFTNYHDYIRALNKYDAEQLLNARDGKQKETQQNQQEQAWVTERETAVTQQAQDFIKDNPEALSLVEEYADVIDEFPAGIQRLFLEADNAPLAFYNLAKEGKLESLGTMSLAKAAMEIGRAQTQAPAKPKTKAPTPLPASRGSVSSGKRPDEMDGKEIRAWMRPD